MSFVLDLSARSVTTPRRIDLAVIEAAMLWPDDEARREEFLIAAIVQDGREWAIRAEDGPILAELMQNQAKLPDVGNLQPEEDRHVHGLIAGKRVLDAALSAHHSERALRLAEIDEKIAKELKGKKQIQPQTLKNKDGPIQKFRPVAHLWAAFHVAVHEDRRTFPCSVDDLPRFLATAETIRAMAETTRLPNSHHTVLRPGETVTLPADLAALLPKVEFVGR